MAELGAYYITIMPSMKGFSSAVNKSLKGLGVSGGTDYSDGFLSVLKGSALGVVLGNLASEAGSAIVSGLSTGIQRIDTIQNFPKVMESLGYSTKDADKSVKLIMDHLDGLPTATQDVVTLTQAIADSTGDLDLATKAALGFNDMMLANGASAGEVTQAQGVLNRVLGKGNATVAQWQSLQSVMPAQLNAVAKELLGQSGSVEELRDKLNNGEVSWNDFLQAIVRLDEEGSGAMASFHDQAIANSTGIGTAIENVSNRIGAGWAEIIDAIGREDISATINNMSYGVRDAMTRMADNIRSFKDELSQTKAYENFQTIVGNVKDRLAEFSGTISGKMAEAIPVMADFVDDVLQWLVDHGEQIGAAVDWVAGALGAVGEVIGGAIAEAAPIMGDLIEDAFQWLFDNGPTIAEKLEDIGGALGTVAETIGGALKDALPVAEEIVGSVFQWIVDHSEELTVGIGGIASAIGGFAAAQAALTVIEGIPITFQAIATVLPLMAGLDDLPAALALIAEEGGICSGVIGALSGALGFLAANPIVLVIAAIAGIVGAIAVWVTTTEEGQQAWEDFCQGVSDLIDGLKRDYDEFVETVKQNFETAAAQWDVFTTNVATWNEDMRATIEQKWSDIKTAIHDQLEQGISDAATQWGTWQHDTAVWCENIREAAMEKWQALGQGIVDEIEWSKEQIALLIDKIRGLFDFEWSFPDLKLPHINWHWNEIVGFLSYPVFDGIDWYAKGGVFDRASVIGIGEAGREAALPLNDSTYAEIARGIANEGAGSLTIEKLADTIVIREEADIDRIAEAIATKNRRERSMGSWAGQASFTTA